MAVKRYDGRTRIHENIYDIFREDECGSSRICKRNASD